MNDQKVYALWHGGVNYSPSSVPEHVEVFPSEEYAKDAFVWRHNLGYWYPEHFEFVNQEPQDVLIPAVEEDSEMWLYFADPSDSPDPYPDLVLKFGPYGEVLTEKV